MSTLVFQNEKEMKVLAGLLIASILLWTVGFYGGVFRADAASLTSVKDTLSNSAPSETATHTITYTSNAAVTSTNTIRITFDPAGDAFNGIQSLVFANLSATGMNLTETCDATSSQVTFATSTGAGDESAILTVCAGDTVASGTKTITIGGNKIINPPTIASYVIRIAGTQPDSADTRIAIVDHITMTASVDTSFTFTITPTTTGTINGEATTLIASTTTTTIPFGTLSPGVPKAAGHILAVTTNARNGFAVTLEQNQNLLSSTGADIDLFADGGSTTPPIAWKTPSSTLDQENTYGHYGITSEDATLTAGDEFGVALYAGNIGAPREVFMHTGPADGLTADKGLTKVAVKIEIGSLQEAGNDYTNSLTYIATPTF